MRSIICRRSAALRASSIPLLKPTVHLRRLPIGRGYAEQPVQRGPAGEPSGETSRLPLIAAIGIVALIPLYYFSQGTKGTGQKAPGEGQAARKENRREGGAQDETRDPRDSATKTSDQDKQRQAAVAK